MKSLAVVAMALSVAFFATAVGTRIWHYGYYSPWLVDDAFFFVRYGNNFLDTGVFAWNIGEGPVYGSTSQLYQLLATAVLWLTERNQVLTVTAAAAIGGFAYLATLPAAYWVSRPQLEPTLRLLVCAVVVALVAFDGQLFLMIGTGMETSWAMALLALSLLASFRVQNGATDRSALIVNALCVALVYLTRPDAALMALAAPAGLALFAPAPALRRAGVMICLLSIALIGVVILACWLYYGDPFPLAFLAKTAPLSTLPPEERDLALGSPLEYLLVTVSLHVPEFLLAFASLLLFFRLPPVLQGAALGMLAFTVYHAFFVLPVMGFSGRFYVPMLPVLALLATPAIEGILRHSGLLSGLRNMRASGWLLLAGLAVLVAHKTVLTALRVAVHHVPAYASDPTLNTKDAALTHRVKAFAFFNGRTAELVRAMGEDCSIASTEDGILSSYAKRNRIVDYSGLHDRHVVHEGFSAERLLTVLRPDVLALPPRWYKDWTAEIEKHPAFTRDYIFEPSLGGVSEGLAFRKDSACALRTRQALYGR
jgi:hypothetical protein